MNWGPTIKKYDSTYQQFLARLKLARENAGLTQTEAAVRLGKTQSYISKCESGELRVDVIELIEFARVYGKPLGYFIETLDDTGDDAATSPDLKR